jgi:colanic acid/amylovoran biosynthesis glycosyltransferase
VAAYESIRTSDQDLPTFEHSHARSFSSLGVGSRRQLRGSTSPLANLTQMPHPADGIASRSTLLVFTASYPYSSAAEDSFLAPELPVLGASFDRVILIPSDLGGSRATVPDHVEVDEGLARVLANASTARLVARGLTSSLFWRDVVDRPSLLGKPRGLRLLLRVAAQSELTRQWLKQFWRRQDVAPRSSVAYSFWFDHTTVGLGLLKGDVPELVVVSRAHGADLYLERHSPPYLPCRPFALSRLDRLFPDSERGVRYVAERYPWFADRCEVARLGVGEPGFLASQSPAAQFSVVSCSMVVPVKRVDLILAAVADAARQRPEMQFQWHHFGDGELREEVESQARAALPPNATAALPGYGGLAALMDFYRTQPIDVFINASVSEGTPVAVMEAISCGIPVIATAVGGNPEIVTAENGQLVGANPTSGEIAGAILSFVDDPRLAAKKREGSRTVWKARYDALSAYQHFTRRLMDLRSARSSGSLN